jgi:hypothetical protein
MKYLWITALLLAAPAHGQTPEAPVIHLSPPAVPQDDPSWEQAKKDAILRAYQLVRIAPVPLPIARPEDKNEQADLNMNDLRKFVRRANYKTDICARHHMRKVMVRGGKSWRCK